MEDINKSQDVLFVLLGAIMVLAMHAGFAFLELGTVRKKKPNQRISQDPCGFCGFNDGLFFHRLLSRLRPSFLQ